VQNLIILNKPKLIKNFNRFTVVIDSADNAYLYDIQFHQWHGNVDEFTTTLYEEEVSKNHQTLAFFDPTYVFSQFCISKAILFDLIDYKISDNILYCLLADQFGKFYLGKNNLEDDDCNCNQISGSFNDKAQILVTDGLLIVFDDLKTYFYKAEQFFFSNIIAEPNLKLSKHKLLV
jgi:hypothetical protein